MENNFVSIADLIVQEFCVHGHSYAICKDEDGFYWGFDLSKLDKKVFNGINGHRNKTMIETLRSCYQAARADNELDNEKLKSCDPVELNKLLSIVKDSYIEVV